MRPGNLFPVDRDNKKSLVHTVPLYTVSVRYNLTTVATPGKCELGLSYHAGRWSYRCLTFLNHRVHSVAMDVVQVGPGVQTGMYRGCIPGQCELGFNSHILCKLKCIIL